MCVISDHIEIWSRREREKKSLFFQTRCILGQASSASQSGEAIAELNLFFVLNDGCTIRAAVRTCGGRMVVEVRSTAVAAKIGQFRSLTVSAIATADYAAAPRSLVSVATLT